MSERPFDLRGVHHLALVCSDMARTVEFYTEVLGMRLVKTLDLPAGLGQHFFFDCGGGDCLAFFWFPDAAPDAPGVARASGRPDQGSLVTAVGSMNHVAFTIPAERFEEYRDRLRAAGVATSEIANHDLSEWQIAATMHPGVYVRSLYFQDPDGILLEFAAWTKALGPEDVGDVVPRTAAELTVAADPESTADLAAAAGSR